MIIKIREYQQSKKEKIMKKKPSTIIPYKKEQQYLKENTTERPSAACP